MNFTSLLFLLGVGLAKCEPICPPHCTVTEKFHEQYFRHVSDLRNSSVAPWDLKLDHQEGREPAFIQYAMCKSCIKSNMISKAIYLQISVYQRRRMTKPWKDIWCRCPYKLAVGCTCVKQQQ